MGPKFVVLTQLTKKELNEMNQEMSDQLAQINKKMMLVMDEKDHQIKVNFRIS